MSSFQIDMLIAYFLHFVLERCDVFLEWFWGASEVGHGTHDAGSFDGSPHSSLIPITEETAISAFNVSVDCQELPQQLDVAPVDIILFDLPEVLLSFFVSVKGAENTIWVVRMG